MEEREPSYNVDGNVNWCNLCEQQYGDSSKKVCIKQSYDPATPLLSTYLKKTKTVI